VQYTILLNRNEDTDKIQTEEQFKFVRMLFETLDIPFEWNSEGFLVSVEEKIKYRKVLEHYNMSVIDDMDGGLKVYVGSDLIAEFYKPKFKLKEDLSEIDDRKKIYLEMDINFWTIFEKNNER